MKNELGLVIGKFYPPHRGHKLLIDAATQVSKRVVIIVCAKSTDAIPGDLRGRWVQEIHPRAEVMVIDDRYDENDSRIWAENTLRWLGRAPDAVFTSEDYGDRYAALMGSKHILVDRPRERVKISGTAIRNDPFATWKYLEPPVRAWFAKRVCVLGAESTGTTTLAKTLAEQLNTAWVEEYGRAYSARKQADNDVIWRTEEFTHIAEEQNRLEDKSARDANRILICDTNSFATIIWHRRYMGVPSHAVEDIARHRRCDLYLLTGDEIPFAQDGLRDGEHIRHDMHTWFAQALAAQAVPWKLLRGSLQERVREGLHQIRNLFQDSTWQPTTRSEWLTRHSYDSLL